MKRTARIILAMLLMLCFAWHFSVQNALSFADEASPEAEGQDNSMQYTLYEGGNPSLAVSFEYPKTWKAKEEQGKIDKYTEVRILGERNKEDTFTCAIVVRSSPVDEKSERYSGIENFYKHYVGHLWPGSKILSEGISEVGGISAMDVAISYVIPPLYQHGLKNIPIPVKKRSVFFEKDGNIYELIFSADEREYGEFAKAFDRALSSFKFR